MMKYVSFILLVIYQTSYCQDKPSLNKPLLFNDTVNLFAFVGEKISLVKYDPNKDHKVPLKVEFDSVTGDTLTYKRAYIMDNAFEAKYRIIQSVFNNLKGDTIDFKVFDHYGRPDFENHSTVLLYISKSEDGSHYFHQKYQFDPLFKRRDGAWVGKKGESILKLFNNKVKTVFRERGLFK